MGGDYVKFSSMYDQFQCNYSHYNAKHYKTLACVCVCVSVYLFL